MLPAAMFVFILIGVMSASAGSLSIRISVGSYTTTVTDSNSDGILQFDSANQIDWNASWGVIQMSSAMSKPATIDLNNPLKININMFTNGSWTQAGTPLTVEVSDTGFTNPISYWYGTVFSVGTGNLTAGLFFDNNNILFNPNTLIQTISGSDTFNAPIKSYVTTSQTNPEYSVTFVTTIDLADCLTNGGGTFGIALFGDNSLNGGSDGGVNNVPEPTVLLLLGFGVAWAGISKKFKF
jgi:hypothetical protein